jgi:alpha-amylase
VESCRLAGLPDLNQNDQFVRSTLKQWVHDTIQTYGFDGIRVDTVPEVPKDFWVEYGQAAGVYSIGEVFNNNRNYVAGYQGPLSALLNYPMWYKLNDSLGQERKSMYEIRTGITENQQAFQDTTVLGNFLDNHDNPRFLSHTDKNIMKNGLAYIIFAEVQMHA